jgi:hypothetical protein
LKDRKVTQPKFSVGIRLTKCGISGLVKTVGNVNRGDEENDDKSFAVGDLTGV